MNATLFFKREAHLACRQCGSVRVFYLESEATPKVGETVGCRHCGEALVVAAESTL